MEKERAKSARVLLVDDCRDTSFIFNTLLSRLGHSVRVATSGEDALACLAEFVPEFVLLDIGMPGMDGFELACRVRQRPGFERVAIVALSGHDLDHDKEAARQAGIDRYLLKPVGVQEISSLMTELLEAKGPLSLA